MSTRFHRVSLYGATTAKSGHDRFFHSPAALVLFQPWNQHRGRGMMRLAHLQLD
jgi:hypothetical protein